MTIEVYFDPSAIVKGQRGCYRARIVERKTIRDAGRTRDEAIREILITAASFDLSGKREDYTIVGGV